MSDDFNSLEVQVRSNLSNLVRWLDFASDFEQSTKSALKCINKDAPREFVYDITGDNSQLYALPATFDRESSLITKVEFPQGKIPPQYAGDQDWQIYEDDSGVLYIMTLSFTPSPTQEIRLTITGKHSFDQTNNTLGDNGFEAIVCKVTELLVKKVEAKILNSADPTLSADTVSYDSKPRNLRELAKYWEGEYQKFAGLTAELVASQATSNKDIVRTDGGEYLWHPRRHR